MRAPSARQRQRDLGLQYQGLLAPRSPTLDLRISSESPNWVSARRMARPEGIIKS